MVTIKDDSGDCQHCERCQLIDGLSRYLSMAASDGPEEWASDAGPIIERMHVATAAMQRLWMSHYGDTAHDQEDATAAAVALVELGELVLRLESELRR